MKVLIHDDHIELVPEEQHEQYALRKVAGKQVNAQFVDQENDEGPLKIQIVDMGIDIDEY